MPPLCFHMGIALEAAPLIGGVVVDNMPSYLFGSTLPDIHMFTPLTRGETHQFELNQLDFDVKVLLPQFRRHFAVHGDEELALATGYLSHLVADVAWITDIYRPYFGPGSALGADSMADLYDRALQFQVDVQARQEARLWTWHRALADFTPKGWPGVDAPSLKRWHDFTLGMMQQERSWQTFPHYVRQFLLPWGKVKQEKVDEFLASLPARIEHLSQAIPQAKLDALQRHAVALSIEVGRKYLYEDMG